MNPHSPEEKQDGNADSAEHQDVIIINRGRLRRWLPQAAGTN